MELPTFTNLDGTMTADGAKLIEWLESQFKEADRTNDLALINALSGPTKHYYTQVYKLNLMTGGAGGMTPEQWLSDYRRSIALNAWRNYQFTVEQEIKKNQLEATTEKTAELEKGLAQFQEAVAAQITELAAKNAALEEELNALKAGKGKKNRKADDEEAETEPPAEG